MMMQSSGSGSNTVDIKIGNGSMMNGEAFNQQ
jgi:hypothetical protein